MHRTALYYVLDVYTRPTHTGKGHTHTIEWYQDWTRSDIEDACQDILQRFHHAPMTVLPDHPILLAHTDTEDTIMHLWAAYDGVNHPSHRQAPPRPIRHAG